MPVQMDRSRINELVAELPERPLDSDADIKRHSNYHSPLPAYSASTVSYANSLKMLFKRMRHPSRCAYITNDLLRELSAASGHGDSALDVGQSKLTPAHRYSCQDHRRRYHL